MTTDVRTTAALAGDVLAEYGRGHAGPDTCGGDPGPAILLAVLAGTGYDVTRLTPHVLTRWLAEIPADLPGVGAFGGLGGLIAGLAATRSLSPVAARTSAVVFGSVVARAASIAWRDVDVAWADYDLFFGPAGLVLGAGSAPEGEPAVAAARRHLAHLAAHPALDPFRAGHEVHPRSAFNVGAINTGLGHGVAGAALALVAVVRADGGTDAERQGLRHIADWLRRESFTDERGLLTWPPIGAEGGSRYVTGFVTRQAWCYGTPGLAWTLLEAADVLGDDDLRGFAVDALERYCRLFDPRLYIDRSPLSATLGVCHGAAGIVAVVDAVERHAGLSAGREVRDGLVDFLVGDPDRIRRLAQDNMTLLDGASGVLATLLALEGHRSWLPILGLR